MAVSRQCDGWHVSTSMVEVINYAKSLDRKIQKGASVEDIGQAMRRLRTAVARLRAEEKREARRG